MGDGVGVSGAVRVPDAVLTGVLALVCEKDVDKVPEGVATAVCVRVRVAAGVGARVSVALALTFLLWLLVGVTLMVGVTEGVMLPLGDAEPEPLGVASGVTVGGSTA